LGRALAQYLLALDNWFIGGESMSLAHLFIAAETLTPAVIRAECDERGITKEDLAREQNIDPATDEKWRQELHAAIRRERVFRADAETHRKAKEASDGLEHGFMELIEIHDRARAVAETTFSYVRECIIDLLKMNDDDRKKLMDKEPLDVQSHRRMMRGLLVPTASPIDEYLSSVPENPRAAKRRSPDGCSDGTRSDGGKKLRKCRRSAIAAVPSLVSRHSRSTAVCFLWDPMFSTSLERRLRNSGPPKGHFSSRLKTQSLHVL
jgi:hypothetical protein